MSKIEQSTGDTYAKIRHRQESGIKDLFKKQKILQGLISIFFYQGPKLKFAIFAETKSIF